MQQCRTQEPVIPVTLLRNRVIAIGNFGSLTIGALLMCVVGFLSTYVQAVMGRSAAVAGFVVATLSVAWSCGSIAAGRVMAKTSYRSTGAAGALALLAGTALLVTLDPHNGLFTMTVGALLIGIGMGVCNIVFLLVVQGSVDWSERGIATASTLFTRTIGQTIGAGLAGAILNFGISRYAPDSIDALDLLLEGSRRKSLDAQHVAQMVDAVAGSLHNVYVVAGLFAMVTLAIALLLPAGLRPTHSAAAN